MCNGYLRAWLIRDMKDTENYPHDFEIGFTYFPRTTEDVESDKNLFMSATMLAVAATSEHPQEAYEFIKYVVTEGAVDIAAGGNYPCYMDAFDDEVVNTFIEGSGLSFEDGQKLFDPMWLCTAQSLYRPALPHIWMLLRKMKACSSQASRMLRQPCRTLRMP